ncbi:MAG TPA: MaoC family dehydratase [Aestuariivirgaceae bacterium]|nr:MaoC family dehydratase [Aestuariivirgaceae bacterium]
MRVFPRLSDLAAEQGRLLGTSSWLEMPQSRIDLFADATEDHQWIHVDPQRTQAELGQSTIAHGYLTLSLIPHFMDEIMRVESATRIINYGAERIRFLSMVPVDARVRGAMTLQRVDLNNGQLRTNFEVTAEIEGVAKPALVAEVIMLFYE